MTLHHPTPLIAHELSNGTTLQLKMDCHQPVGSFKIRGIGHFCERAAELGATALVSSSGGNAGYAVAYAGRQLGLEVTVVTPETTPKAVRDRISRFGATVQVRGQVWDEAHQHALDVAASPGTWYVPPFDEPLIWQGHASLIHEVADSGLRPDGVIVAVGGGGLLCGIIQGLRDVGWEGTPVLAVETQGAASLAAAVRAGQLVDLDRITSIATSLAARKVAAQALTEAQAPWLTPVQVSDAQAIAGCVWFADEHRTLVEPACGAALSVALDRDDGKTWLVVVCGGIGVSLALLDQWRQLLP